MPVLSVEGLAKSFGEIHAVTDVSFAVEPGEIYGLLGPNGAGKTTSISMICGLLKPDRGEVAINGQNFGANPRKAQEAMGVVPQEIALYEELSGLENLIFWGRIAGLSAAKAKTRAGEILEMLTLTERSKEAVKNYSGGMKRRINIGCALMHQPDLVLMDEPTVGIDPQARRNILEFIRGLAASGTAILYTTHYLEEAETLCNRIGIIDNGQLHAEGTLAELQARLGGDRVFILEGNFEDSHINGWDGFREDFELLHQNADQLMVVARKEQTPADSLAALLNMPGHFENITLKKPSLNDVFIRLTGRDLRE